MKLNPITRTDQVHLIQRIKLDGSFQGTRGGAHVTIKKVQDLFGTSIYYQATVKRTRVAAGNARTVAEAVDVLNQAIIRRGLFVPPDKRPKHGK